MLCIDITVNGVDGRSQYVRLTILINLCKLFIRLKKPIQPCYFHPLITKSLMYKLIRVFSLRKHEHQPAT